MALLDVNALVALAWNSHIHQVDRQVIDAHLLALARRRGIRLITFGATLVALVALGEGRDVEFLTPL
ncbi:hypothetical protein B4U45_19710 [Mycobacterium persicum]|uniref:Ribonuclease VapC38 n=1 Tax=Mycobacterium persicum TaxID=1487726 RepID=A0A8E2LPR6_9MYCO|nr:hypothetical protein [Mycobacterium persicum]KZS84165.1 hypothetical protein A4G31_18555 [Mycobacterium persicum]ORB59023.1 hypothetical protein BST40_00155 [Mycobacterium persicum]ORB96382.1 hypothetical protein B1T44_19885 [Mycobacterium persicum]ORC03083.1 hypothetical protein B1T48_19330 [Mycobacterium persicum]ORC08493.1 hypothetical protein B4U45_19710 [Mycobacterium persicum]